MSPIRPLESSVQTLAGDVATLARPFTSAIGSALPSVDPSASRLPAPEVDTRAPVTPRMLASRTNLSLVQGDPNVDLRSISGAATNVILRGSHGTHEVVQVHRRLERTLLSTRVACDEQIRVRATLAIPIFECAVSRPFVPGSAQIADLPVVLDDRDAQTGDHVVLRAEPRDAETLGAIWPLLSALVRIHYARVHSDGCNVVLSSMAPGADVTLSSPSYCIEKLVAIAEQLERGSSDGATLSMTTLAPAQRIDMHRRWSASLAHGDDASSRYLFVGGLVVLTSLGSFGIEPLRVLVGLAIASIFFGRVAWARWRRRSERLALHDDAFEWRSAWGATRRIRYADVISHHRAMRPVGGNAWVAELVLVLASEELVLATPAASELAHRLDVGVERRSS